MAVCIECSAPAPAQTKSKLYCQNCSSKVDKYSEVNNTLKIIDLLLLKESAFRHYLFNRQCSRCDLAKLALIYFISAVSIHLAGLQITPLKVDADRIVKIDLYYSSLWVQFTSLAIYLACLRCVFRRIDFALFLYAVLMSSFYNVFKIVFSIWNYNVVQYFIIVEILSSCGNIFALLCIEGDFATVSSTVLLAKITSIAVPLSIYTNL
ncbi:hypothetical protein PAPHI01_1774 [Pancytospora philotis]|nr:hypothetical protein PAPHI01_1774 [Pancytospora philotis]